MFQEKVTKGHTAAEVQSSRFVTASVTEQTMHRKGIKDLSKFSCILVNPFEREEGKRQGMSMPSSGKKNCRRTRRHVIDGHHASVPTTLHAGADGGGVG